MAHLSDDRRRQMEDELSRFENEIAASQQAMVAGALRFLPHTIHTRPVLMAPQSGMILMQPSHGMMGGMQLQQSPMTHLLPSMGLGLPPVRGPIKILPLPGSVVQSAQNTQESHPPQPDYSNVPPPAESEPKPAETTTCSVIEGAPTVYIRPKAAVAAAPTGNRTAYSIHTEEKKDKAEEKSSVPPTPVFHNSSSSSTGQAPAYSIAGASSSNQSLKPQRYVRAAGGQVWEDTSLQEWDPSDFRLFCGDLGNEVSDELLAKAFRKYPSFQKAKVIREKRTNKTKGYGFVSFKDPQDFIRAQREMNGKYVGNRPIKLRKSDWQDRQLDVVRKKNKEKKKLGLKVR